MMSLLIFSLILAKMAVILKDKVGEKYVTGC